MTIRRRRKVWKKLGTNIAILLGFTIVIVVSIMAMRSVVMENSRKLGRNLVTNYSISETANLDNYKSIIDLCVSFIEEREEKNVPIEKMREDLYPFMENLVDIIGQEGIQIYGKVYDGTKAISNNPNIEDDGELDWTQADFYQGTMDADGEIYISDAYMDEESHLPMVTLAKKIGDTKGFLAMDITFSRFDENNLTMELPKDASYYLCDKKGTLIYYRTSMNHTYEEYQEFMDRLQGDLDLEDEDKALENIIAMDGKKRNVYYYAMDNGWVAILTIPEKEILSGIDTFNYIGFAVIFLGFVMVVLIALRDYKKEVQTQEIAEERDSMAEENRIYQSAMISTVQAYSEIYYINLEEDTYKMLYPNRGEGAMSGEYENGLRVHFEKRLVSDEAEDVREFIRLENIKKEMANRDHIDMKYRRLKPDGEYEWCQVMVIASETEGDETTSATLTIRNIDEIIKNEEQQKEILALAAERAEAANYAKTDFLSKMSHDIRTPMNAIIGLTAIAGAHIDDRERLQDCLAKITSSSRHLLSLINEVLDMSRIESGKITLTEEDFNLSDLIENMITMVKPQIAEHGHELNVHINNIAHEDVYGDSLRIQQAFVNIVSNAVKYTPDGGTINITISEQTTNKQNVGCYEFIFEDNGIGMSEEFQKKLFQPFERADDKAVTQIQGTGLGMTITKNLVNIMNGDIKVESKEGVGTKFIITIFLKIQDGKEVSAEELLELPVLVVDDDATCCETTALLLQDIGMNSEWVTSGKKAVERVVERHETGDDFFAVIVDWKMPEMDGVETTRQIRKAVGTDVPIIVFSSYDWTDIEAEAKSAGVDVFIAKPLFRSRLVSIFKDIVNEGVETEEPKNELSDIAQLDYSNKRVLLVEDNELNREIAQSILEMTGIQIETAENGKIGLDMVSASEDDYYDLVFMDIQMPVMNGYEAASAIRALGRKYTNRIPIIAMTANAFAEDVVMSKNAGMNEHIAKPLDIKKLNEVMKRWL